MTTEALTVRPPTPDETEKASEAVTALARSLSERGLSMKLRENGGEINIELPHSIGMLVVDLLSHISRGEMVTLVPYGAELTTQKAADLLNVSRPHLTKLLDAGEIPFHRTGAHRRIRVTDLLAYKARRDHRRSDALDKLQRLGQEFDAEVGTA